MREDGMVSGLSAMSVLGIVLVTLKLCSVINWTWGWVLAPFWGPLVLVVVLGIIVLTVSYFLDKGEK